MPQGAAEKELQQWRDWAQLELRERGLDQLLDAPVLDSMMRGMLSSQFK